METLSAGFSTVPDIVVFHEDDNAIKIYFDHHHYEIYNILEYAFPIVYFSKGPNKYGVLHWKKGWKILGERRNYRIEFGTLNFFYIKEITRYILRYVDLQSLKNFCQVNKTTSIFTTDTLLWTQRVRDDFSPELILLKAPRESYVQQYRRIYSLELPHSLFDIMTNKDLDSLVYLLLDKRNRSTIRKHFNPSFLRALICTENVRDKIENIKDKGERKDRKAFFYLRILKMLDLIFSPKIINWDLVINKPPHTRGYFGSPMNKIYDYEDVFAIAVEHNNKCLLNWLALRKAFDKMTDTTIVSLMVLNHINTKTKELVLSYFNEHRRKIISEKYTKLFGETMDNRHEPEHINLVYILRMH